MSDDPGHLRAIRALADAARCWRDRLGQQAALRAADDVEELRPYVVLVQRDVRRLGIELDLELAQGLPGWHPADVLLVIDGGSRIAVLGEGGQGVVEMFASLADLVHEEVVEDLPSRHLPTNWPRCPRHPHTHPLEVRVVDDEVVWACPRTGAAHVRVGDLARLDVPT